MTVTQVEITGIAQACAASGTEWAALADAVPGATVFMRPGAASAWDAHISHETEGSVLLARRDGRLVGVLPLMTGRVRRGPAMVPRIDYARYDRDLAPPQRRPFSLKQTTQLMSWRMANVRPSVLCRPEDAEDVYEAFAETMAQSMTADQILMPAFVGEQARLWMRALQRAGLAPWAHKLDRSFLYCTSILPSADIIAAQSRNFRRKMSKAQKAADELGLEFDLISERTQVRTRMEAFAHLAQKSWKSADPHDHTIGIAYEGPQRRVAEALVAQDDAGCVPVMVTVSQAGAPLLMMLSFRHGSTLGSLFTFWDGRADKASPGYLAVARTIDWAVEQGVTRLDWNATQPWLSYFADDTQELCHVVAFRRTVRGRVLDRIARWRADRLPIA